MRKIALFAAAAMVLLASCAKEELPSASADAQQLVHKTLEVGLDNSLTKTALGTELSGKFPVVWTEGDEIAVVENIGTEMQKYSTYRLLSGAGTSQGTFEYVSGDAHPEVIKDVVFPASAMIPVSSDLKTVHGIHYPSQQNYVKDNIDPAAAVMHFHSEVKAPIVLQPAASILCIPLKGKTGDVVTSLTWKHMDGHTRKFTLNCPEGGIKLSEQATKFYISVSPMFYDKPDDAGNDLITANAIAYVHLQNGAVQVKTLAGKKLKAGNVHCFPEWTMDRKSQWTFKYVGSEREDLTWHGVPMGPAKYMIDGDDRSWWEFKRVLKADQSGPQMAKHHKFIIDLGQVEHITGLKFKGKEDKTSPKYGITNTSGSDIFGSQSYNPPYNVKAAFVTDLNDPEVAAQIVEFKKFPDVKDTALWGMQEEHYCKKNAKGISYYYGDDMKSWWSFDLKTPRDARYIIMHISHGWNNAGDGSTAAMLKIAEFDIY